jgi:hypothetical protein
MPTGCAVPHSFVGQPVGMIRGWHQIFMSILEKLFQHDQILPKKKRREPIVQIDCKYGNRINTNPFPKLLTRGEPILTNLLCHQAIRIGYYSGLPSSLDLRKYYLVNNSYHRRMMPSTITVPLLMTRAGNPPPEMVLCPAGGSVK